MRDRFTTVFRKACRPPSVIINRYSLNLTMRVYVIIRTFIVKNLIKKKRKFRGFGLPKDINWSFGKGSENISCLISRKHP